ncbi:sigma-54 dependent transcriptional regulator [Chlamydiia bacterium]|nr:sigma-54 dependent transcriptional regulator [Chlamydiia bacterium]
MTIDSILVVDDEPLMRDLMSDMLKSLKYDVYTASDGLEALDLLSKTNIDLTISDLKMPKMDGMALLTAIKKEYPYIPVLIMTAHGTVETAVQAMMLGAFNFILKPFTIDAIKALLSKAEDHRKMVSENQFLKKEVVKIKGNTSVESAVFNSPKMKEILENIDAIAESKSNVFIYGESGTGKEVISKMIHERSRRSDETYIRVNCAAITETLWESEFFGHEKGAFTGADKKRIGRFELANNGTLLLDEITEIPQSMQAKLLRVVQEKNFERVGGTKTIEVDVRLVSTSNRTLDDIMTKHGFRQDLYYRLNVIPIHIPPLRERREDIIPLAEYYLKYMSRENHKRITGYSKDAKEKLLAYNWPGNVRELINVVERAVVLSNSNEITEDFIAVQQKTITTVV